MDKLGAGTKVDYESSKELDCSNLLVGTWNYEGEEEFKSCTIEFVSLWKWLL